MAEAIMRVNKKVIDIRSFPGNHLLIEGYLDGLISDMLDQNETTLKQHKKEPEFKIIMETAMDLSMDNEEDGSVPCGLRLN